MIDGANDVSAERIHDLLNEAAPFASGRRVHVAFTFPVDRNVVQACLDHPAVAGVILADQADTLAFDDASRVGCCLNAIRSRWRFPTALARTVIVLGDRNSVALRFCWYALRRGITSIVFVEPDTGAVWPRNIIGFVVRNVYHRIRTPLMNLKCRAQDWISDTRQDLKDWWKEVGARWNRTIENSPRLLNFLFALHLRHLFRSANRIPANLDARTDVVLLVVGSLAPGGSERQVVNTALMLKAAGHMRPVVVCARLGVPRGGFYRPLLESAGIEVVDLYGPGLDSVDHENRELLELCKSEGAKLRFEIAEDLIRYLAYFLKTKPKIVHAFLDENNIKAGVAAVLARVPRIVFGVRSLAPDNYKYLHRNYMRPGYRVLLRRSETAVSSNSRAGARDYRRWLRMPALKIHVVSNGIDFDAFAVRDGVDSSARQRLGLPLEAKIILSVMRLSEEKQPILWARAVIEISRRRPDVYFVLIGDGPMRPEVETALQLASVMDRVRLVLQTPEVPAYMRASDLFLLTSRIEGLPNTLIEAQAVGVPVVTTPAGGAAETLSEGKTGLVAPGQSPTAVANACLAILDDDRLCEHMGKTAPEFVRQKFSLEQMLQNTLRLYGS